MYQYLLILKQAAHLIPKYVVISVTYTGEFLRKQTDVCKSI